MKGTGVVRKLDDLGRVVIPVEIRRNNGWSENQPLEVLVEEDKVILKAFKSSEFSNHKTNAVNNLNEVLKNASETDRKLIREALQFLEEWK